MSPSRRFALVALVLAVSQLLPASRAQLPAPDVVAQLKTHTDTVEAVAVSTDGKLIATGSFDKTVKLWDAATGAELRTYSGAQGHTGQVLCVAFSAQGDQIATGGADNKLCIWDVPVPFPVKSFAFNSTGTAVAVGADAKSFAVAGADGVVKVFPVGEEKGALELKGHTGAVIGVSAFGANWATAGADKTIRFWAADGKQTGAYLTGTAEITGFAARSDGQGAFTTSADGALRYWQAPQAQPKAFPVLKDAITAFHATTDAGTVLIATADKTVSLGSTGNNQFAGTFTGAKGQVDAVSLSPDAQTVAAGVADGQLILWDRQGKIKAEVGAHAGGVTGTAYHPSQPILFTAGADGHVKGWALPIAIKKDEKKDAKDKKDAKKDEKPTKYEFKAHTGKVTALLVHPGSGQVVTAGADKMVRIWDATKPEKPVREFGPLAAVPVALALTRDNTGIAAAFGKEVVLWSLADGKELAKLAQSADVLSLSFTTDKARVLLGRADNLAVLAEVATGLPVQAYAHAAPVRGVIAFPNGPTVLTASSDKSVTVSPITCTRVVALGTGKPGLVLSPQNERVYSVGPGKDVSGLNSASGAKEQTFEAGAEATAAAVSKDLQRIAVGAADGSIRIYTTNDAKLVGSFAAGAPVVALQFQPTNTVLVSLVKDKDNTATAWNVGFQPGQPVPPEFGRKMQTFPNAAGAAGLAFNSEGQFYTASAKQVHRYKIAADVPTKTFPHPDLVYCAAFDNTGDRIATGCTDGKLRVYDVPKNAPKEITAHVQTMPQQVQHPIYAIQWTNDFKQVFTASFDKSIKLWDAASGTMLREFKAAPEPMPIVEPKKDDKNPPPKKDEGPFGHRDQVFSLALSKDGKFLASSSSDRSVKLWDVAAGKVVREFQNPDLKPVFPGEPAPSHPGWVHAVRFSPDGAQLVTAGAAPRGKSYIAVWNAADGKRLFCAERDFGPIHSMALTPDGSKMVIGFMGVPRARVEGGAAVLKVPGK
jgi:WD40 repeat protein